MALSGGGHRVEITIRRMTSFLLLPLFTISYEVKALNFSGTLEFISVHNGDVKNYCNPNDPRVAGESFQHLRPVSAEVKDGVSYLVTETVYGGKGCTFMRNRCSLPGEFRAGRTLCHQKNGNRYQGG